MTAVARIRHIC